MLPSPVCSWLPLHCSDLSAMAFPASYLLSLWPLKPRPTLCPPTMLTKSSLWVSLTRWETFASSCHFPAHYICPPASCDSAHHTPFKPACLCTCLVSSWSRSPLLAWQTLQPLLVFSCVLLPDIWGPPWLCCPAEPLRFALKWAWSTPGVAFSSLCHLLLCLFPHADRWLRLLKGMALAYSFLLLQALMGAQ